MFWIIILLKNKFFLKLHFYCCFFQIFIIMLINLWAFIVLSTGTMVPIQFYEKQLHTINEPPLDLTIVINEFLYVLFFFLQTFCFFFYWRIQNSDSADHIIFLQNISIIIYFLAKVKCLFKFFLLIWDLCLTLHNFSPTSCISHLTVFFNRSNLIAFKIYSEKIVYLYGYSQTIWQAFCVVIQCFYT